MHKDIADGFVEVKGDLQTELSAVETNVKDQIGSVDARMKGGLGEVNVGLESTKDQSQQ